MSTGVSSSLSDASPGVATRPATTAGASAVPGYEGTAPSTPQAVGGRNVQRAARIPASPKRLWLIGLVVLVGVLCAVSALYEIERGREPAGTNARVLVGAPSYAWLPQEQFNSVAFVVAGTATISGVFSDTNGLVVYLMTPSQLVNLTRNGVPGGYYWTSGAVPSPTHYELSLVVGTGAWDLVFYNPSATIPSGVDFWSSVVLTAG
jgi:hypothetical protein